MKHLNLFGCAAVAAMLVSVASCNKEEIQTPVNNEPVPQQESYSSLEWDESYHPYSDTKAGNSSMEMAVTSANVYLSAVYEGASINDLSFKRISGALDPIEVTYTFPRYYFDTIDRPTKSSVGRSLQAAINSPYFSGKQLESFEYDFRQFTKYNELKLAFGANVNVANIFKLDASANYDKINAKSGLFARIVQKNFSVIMDYPYDGNVFADDDRYYEVASKDPVYVNSITYGRMGIIAIESEYSYEELKTAFKAALTVGKFGGELNLSAENKELLEKATIRILISGGAGADVCQTFTGFDKFSEFIVNGGEFTAETPGVPIFFTANRVVDDSVYTSSF